MVRPAVRGNTPQVFPRGSSGFALSHQLGATRMSLRLGRGQQTAVNPHHSHNSAARRHLVDCSTPPGFAAVGDLFEGPDARDRVDLVNRREGDRPTSESLQRQLGLDRCFWHGPDCVLPKLRCERG